MRWRLAWLIGAAMAGALAAPARAEDGVCPAVWPPRTSAEQVSVLTPEGLLSLRDIAQPVPGGSVSSPLAVSPDGRMVAFFVTEPVLEANDVCETLVVVDVAAPRKARVIDSGGRGIRSEEVLRGVRRPSGYFEVNVPVWSPDGRELIYRKRVADRTQVWRASLDGGATRQLSHSAEGVEQIDWSADGTRVLYTVRNRAPLIAARRAEARRGYLYDSRFLPHLAAEPQLPADLRVVVLAVPAEGGEETRASAADVEQFSPPESLVFAIPTVKAAGGLLAGADPIDETYLSDDRVWAELAPGHRKACPHPACTGALRGLWWHDGEVFFLKRAGWHREESVVQAWSPSSGGVRTLVRTRERLVGCVDARGAILCIADQARHPRTIIAIDRQTARRRELFDPNPELDTSEIPRVERLRWRNKDGLETWADLVLPPGTPPPSGWPMVVVQYRSDGFLRGGTGDEYPVFPFAARGIAVFSFQAPDSIEMHTGDGSDTTALVAAGHRNWSDRRSIHDSLMRGLDLTVGRGDIDPARIGISGLSDGSTTARFALIHDNRFAAAAISTCCLEPFTIMALGGPAQADWFRLMGYPDASRPDPDFWRPASLALNAATVHTPLLMQLSDDEYLQSLETYTALREHGDPVELYVFPGEHHLKWQPVHRAAIYERNLDWFSFWLQGRVDPDPLKAEQYRRWDAMKQTPSPASSRP